MPAPTVYAALVPVASSLLLVGGEIGAAGSESAEGVVRIAPVMAGGTLGTWAPAPPLSERSYKVSAHARGDRVFAVGGIAIGGERLERGLATSVAGSTVDGWSAAPSLPQGRGWGAIAGDDRGLYLVGGTTGASTTAASCENAVLHAGLDANGSLGPWSATAQIFAREGAAAVAHRGVLYVSGGIGCGGGLSDEVLFTPIVDGVPGMLAPTTKLPEDRYGHAMFAFGDFVYVIAGDNGGGPTNAVYRAPVVASGVSAWTVASEMPARLSQAAVALR